ncbi:MAG: thymidine phosphorylase [bacterium]|nr:thymidine phosphorylase [bacterium]
MNKTGEFKSPEEKNAVIETIRKQLLGKKLSYREIYTLMDSIAKQKLGDVLTTYFAASSYSRGFSNEELYYFTKAMVETGEKLTFKGIVADKHSIGGLPGTRTTFIVVPIVAAAGFTIPKSSSRAITTPSGTADDMEVLSKVIFTKEQIYKIVRDTNGCIVWGGSFNIAPADDVIIQIEEPLLFESFDKIVISIMAKKVAFGSNHIVIDIPYGEGVKVHRIKDAEILKVKFEYLAKRFNMKIKCLISKTDQPIGRGIGPILETREAIRVLQQKENRPLDLEKRSLTLAGSLLDLCLEDSPKEYKNGLEWATHILRSNLAFVKMKEIIKAQGGNPNIDSEDLKPGKFEAVVLSHKKGVVKKINSQNATIIAKILGAPGQKRSGIFLNKKIGEPVFEKEILYTLYSENVYNLKEAKSSLRQFPIVLM